MIMGRISGRDAIKRAMKEYGGSGIGFFSLKDDGDRAVVRFLHEDDKDLDLFVVHEIEIDGKKTYVECLQDESCPICRAGKRPSLKVFFSLYSYQDEKILVWDRGPGIIDQILGFIDKYGFLNSRDYEIVRHGKAKDTKTSYQLFPEDKGPMRDSKGQEMEMPKRPEILGRFVLQWTKEQMENYVESNGPDKISRREAAASKRNGPGF